MKTSRIIAALAAVLVLASSVVATQPAAAATAPTPIVQGSKLVDSQTNATFVPHGVNIPGLEYSCVQGWRTLPAAGEFTAIASWKINTVRLPLNESCWLGLDGAPSNSTVAQYKADVKAWVDGAVAAGLVVILDLHWNAPAGHIASGQRAMPDERSAAFWTSVATAYAGNKSVLFELFNEPYSRSGFTLTWDCWKNGGCLAPVENDATGTLSGAKYTVTGMQTLVTAVRGTGASQPLLLGGLNYSNDLSGWLANKPTDPLNQLVAAWHNYPGQGCSTTCWNSTVTTVAASVPIVTTEFGNTAETTSTAPNNSGNYLVPFMTWADAHGIGYMPWAWWDVGAAEANGNGSDIYALYSGNFVPKSPSGTKFYNYLSGLPSSTDPWQVTLLASPWLSGQLATKTCGLTGGGCYQPFAGGWLVSSPAGAFALRSEVVNAWANWGRWAGILGYPTSAPSSATGGTYTQTFTGGTITVTNGLAAVTSVSDPWFNTSLNSPWLGAGTANRTCGLPNSGCYQPFAGGWLVSSPAGAFALRSEVVNAWANWGRWAGILGYPTSAPSSATGGTYTQTFTGGTITVTNGLAAVTSVSDPWFNTSLNSPWLGAGTANQSCGLPGGGCYQPFTAGWLVSSPAGAFAMRTEVVTVWANWGAWNGVLGYPTTAPSNPAGGTYTQTFTGGTVTVTNGVAALTAIADPWFNTSINSPWLGAGTANRTCGLTGGGCYQPFTGGWLVSSPAGAYALRTEVVNLWKVSGRESGALGYPTSAPSSPTGGTYTQTFRGGTVRVVNGVASLL